ncbi:MAG TPA: LLM class flavin-dependent oxidoreductase [Candidatus Binataceae bacterium]|nr:LLM class flavin-dependent oxidoreductase [Candidatus Binataceae bacterium]
MKFDLITLGDHLPDPHTGRYHETQAERHRMWVDMGVRAEEAGFEAVWIGEHHCSDYIVSSPQMLLATIAGRTDRIRLGTGVSLLPNNDPVRLAEEFATLDLLSMGRAEIGFGSGLTAHTFRLFGQDMSRSDEMSAENLALIQKLWNEREVRWEGKFRAPIESLQFEPRTFSGRAIPISRATANSMAVVRDAGRCGHKLMLMTVVGSFADAKPLAAAYREAYQAAGHAPAGMKVSAIAYVYVQPDGRRAREFWFPYRDNYRAFARVLTRVHGLTRGLGELYATVPDLMAEREGDFCGSPAEVRDRILAGYEQMGGFDTLICYFDLGGISRAATFATIDLFAESVMPAVETALREPKERPDGRAR